MRPLKPLIFAVLGACTTQAPTDSTYMARFPEFPRDLFSALEETCNEPAQNFQRVSMNVVECREYLDPETTAAIILQYDGTTEDLPQLVVRLTTWPDDQEYLLKTDAYLNVPQKSGGPIHVVYPSARYERKLASLYRTTGGVPE